MEGRDRNRPGPNDYHPDHRYAGIVVQDASYMVTVPDIVPEAPALHKDPVFLYFSDHFQRPQQSGSVGVDGLSI